MSSFVWLAQNWVKKWPIPETVATATIMTKKVLFFFMFDKWIKQNRKTAIISRAKWIAKKIHTEQPVKIRYLDRSQLYCIVLRFVFIVSSLLFSTLHSNFLAFFHQQRFWLCFALLVFFFGSIYVGILFCNVTSTFRDIKLNIYAHVKRRCFVEHFIWQNTNFRTKCTFKIR